MKRDVEAVEMVDKLMITFRNKIQPSDADIVKAYDLGINVKLLENYIKEVEFEQPETKEEYGWSDYGE